MSPAGANISTRPSRTYKEALKADPDSAAISDELAEFYVQAGLLSDAESDAQKALAKDPKDLGALRLLARIYTSQIGGQNNRINQDMLKKAIEQYKKITDIASKDVDAWVMLGRLGESGARQCRGGKGLQEGAGSRSGQRGCVDGAVIGVFGFGQ